MKKLLLLFVGTFILFISCSDNSNSPVIKDMGNYMPLAVGNYWVYENTDLFTNETSIDSFVVFKKITIDGKEAFYVNIFRDDSYRDYGIFYRDKNGVQLYGKALFPLLDSADTDCWTYQRDKWFDIASRKDYWSFEDSVEGDSWPSVIPSDDDPSGWETIMSKTAWLLKIEGQSLNNAQTFDIDGRTVETKDFYYFGKRIHMLIEPENAQFTTTEKYEYLDSNNRSILANKFILRVHFADRIGIVKTFENLYDGRELILNRERKLIRYKLN